MYNPPILCTGTTMGGGRRNWATGLKFSEIFSSSFVDSGKSSLPGITWNAATINEIDDTNRRVLPGSLVLCDVVGKKKSLCPPIRHARALAFHYGRRSDDPLKHSFVSVSDEVVVTQSSFVPAAVKSFDCAQCLRCDRRPPPSLILISGPLQSSYERSETPARYPAGQARTGRVRT